MNLRQHPSDDTLELYALGRLSEPELEQVDIHLLMCHACQESVTEADQYTIALKSVLAETRPLAAAPQPWWRRISWTPSMPILASGLAALLLAGIYLQSPANLTPAAVTLRSERGSPEQFTAHGPAGAPLRLQIQSRHLTISPGYRISVVDKTGRLTWSGGLSSTGATVNDGLSAGTYWVRLYDGEQLLQEYALQVD